MVIMEKGVDMSRYFTDRKLWIKDDDAFMKQLALLCAKLETSDDVRPFQKLWGDERQLTFRLFMRFTSRAGLVYQPGFGSAQGGENLEELMDMYEYYVASTFIIEPMDGKIFMIVHSHAPGALNSAEYLESAETFLKGKLEKWIDESCGFLYGLIFVGGKMAVYYMDVATKTFSRIVNGIIESADSPPKPENWRPIVDVEVLKSLLGIFRQGWYRLEEREFRAAVVCRKLGRMPLRGYLYEGEVEKMMQESLGEAERCRLESALQECGIKRAPESGEQAEMAAAGGGVDGLIGLGNVSPLDIGKRKLSPDSDGSGSSKENSPVGAIKSFKRQALDLAQ